MASGNFGDLLVKIGFDADGVFAGLKDIGDQFKAVEKDGRALERAFSGFDQLGARLTDVGTSLTAAISLPLIGVGAGAVAASMQIDDAMDLIRSTTGATGERLNDLGSVFSQVFGKTVPDSSDKVAQAVADLSVRTGQSGDALAGLSTQVLNLSRVSGNELGPMIESSTRLFGDWSVSTDKQGEALDYMFRTSQTTGIGINRLMELVVQFGAPLRALGFDMNESAALMGKWEQEGVNLETVLSGLRFALGNFAKAGLEPKQALEDVIDRIKNASSESEATGIAFQTFGKRAAIDMGRAIIEGRFEIDSLVTSLKSSKETINSAAADTAGFAEKLDLLKNRVIAAGAPLGDVLVSALERVLDIGLPFLETVTGWAQAFKDADPAIQTAIIAVGAVAAAIGPLLVVGGSLLALIPSISAGWVTLTGLFSTGPILAITEAIGTAGGLAGALGAIAPVVGGIVAAWALWTFQDDILPMQLMEAAVRIAGVAFEYLWGAVTAVVGFGASVAGAIGRFLQGPIEMLLLPVNKLIEAYGWLNAKVRAFNDSFDSKPITQHAEDVGKAEKAYADLKPKITDVTKAQTDAARILRNATTAHTANTAAVKKSKDAHNDAHPKVKKLLEVDEVLAAKVALVASEHRKLVQDIAQYQLAAERGKTKTEDLSEAFEKFLEQTDALKPKISDITKIYLPSWAEGLGKIQAKQTDLTGAMKTLGITSQEEHNKIAAAAIAARDVVLGSGLATDFEKKSAVYKALKAQVDAALATGQIVPAEQRALLEKMENELNTGKGKDVRNASDALWQHVSTTITNFAQSAAKTLFDGDQSWGEKAKKIWGELQTAMTSLFIEPATKALSDFVTGVLGDLMGGKGFGGIFSHVSKIGDELKAIFGIGGSGATTATNAAGAAGGAANTAAGAAGSGGGAAGAAGGAVGSTVTSVVTAIASVATAISSVIGNFQMAGMNKTLDLIEHEVRYSQIHLKELVERGQNLFLAELPVLRSLQVQYLADHAWRIHDVWERLGQLVDLVRMETNPALNRIQASMAGSRAITINFNGAIGSQSLVDYAVQEIGRNLR